MKYFFFHVLVIAGIARATAQTSVETHRPRLHFSPKSNWMNDPNGMVYFNGVYHLFFQYYPNDKVWGPMHWGHAVSTDLVSWKEQPIALYPDSLGYIFSGSAVADTDNTTGLASGGQTPLVAIFTHHNPELERQRTGRHEYQSIAYSLDNGKNWTKYKANPVLPNPGITDFRDPKVSWYAPGKKWIMTLAAKDRVHFYSSGDLKTWVKESEFGAGEGAHGGVWECPDLFPLTHQGKEVWVLIVNINPGGPNKGSAGQYFLGDFDGKNFRAHSRATKWLDFGADNYAAVTFSNTGNRRILMGWMNNWQYAQLVPTTPWRGAATLARELGLETAGGETYLTSRPVKELEKLYTGGFSEKKLKVRGEADLTLKSGNKSGLFRLDLTIKEPEDFTLVLANENNEELLIGYSKAENQYYIDRTRAGQTNFEKGFGARHTAPRFKAAGSGLSLSVVADAASVEVFADEGLTVMTDTFFPKTVMNRLLIRSSENLIMDSLRYTRLKPVMPAN